MNTYTLSGLTLGRTAFEVAQLIESINNVSVVSVTIDGNGTFTAVCKAEPDTQAEIRPNMSESDALKLKILCNLKFHGNRDEFLRGEYYLAPSEVSAWGDGSKYAQFWEAVYSLRDKRLIHIRHEANANMLALTQDGANIAELVKDILQMI